MTKPTPDLTDYRENAKGHFVPKDSIDPLDLEKDALVYSIANKAMILSDALRCLRNQAHADIAALVSLAADKYDVKIGGTKGNVTLYSFDGRFKIVRAISETFGFDEKLKAAKALIDEYLAELTTDSSPELKTLVGDVFQVDKEGNINVGRVLELRKFKFKNDKWERAMNAISDALLVSTSRTYIRVYMRDEKGGYEPINLDLANANYNAAPVAATGKEEA